MDFRLFISYFHATDERATIAPRVANSQFSGKNGRMALLTYWRVTTYTMSTYSPKLCATMHTMLGSRTCIFDMVNIGEGLGSRNATLAEPACD